MNTATQLRRWVTIAMAMAVAACDDPAGPVPVDRIALSAPAATVIVGQTLQITAVVMDEDGDTLTDRSVEWSSANDAVATVSAAGLVTGVSPGGVVITAKAEGKTSEFTLNVVPVPVASVVVAPDPAEVPVGTTRELFATARDAAGTPLTGRAVVWTSSNPEVATVSSSGVVTALRQGAATITATVDGQTGTSRINAVPGPVAVVAVTPQSPSVRVGATIPLAAETRDASGAVVTGRVVTWASSDPSRATVSSTGVVTGVAPGAVTITATSEGRSGTTTVTVLRIPVSAVRFDVLPTPVLVGDTFRIRAVALDSAGRELPDRTVTFAGSNNAAATISSSGHLSAVGAGSVQITATSEGVTATATINVADYFVSLGGCAGQSVTVGGSCTATASIRNAANGQIIAGRLPASIVSSDPSIARTSAPTTGPNSISVVVTGVSPGQVTLTGSSVGANGITRTGTAPFTVNP